MTRSRDFFLPLLLVLLQQILNFSQVSEEGRRFVKHLSDLKVQSTLFVPDNSGLSENQVRLCVVHLSRRGHLTPPEQVTSPVRACRR